MVGMTHETVTLGAAGNIVENMESCEISTLGICCSKRPGDLYTYFVWSSLNKLESIQEID